MHLYDGLGLEAAFALIALPELLRQKNKKSTCDVIKVISVSVLSTEELFLNM